MTDRGSPIADGATACPFVAFESDRDERSTRPDHRHRCYAEVRPAPRAVAHQEAFCLSSAFPSCPTFQDWARREAARARAGAPAEVAGEDAGSIGALAEPPDAGGRRSSNGRDWAAPPRWTASQERAIGAAGAAGAAGAGLAASRWVQEDASAGAPASHDDAPGSMDDPAGSPAFLAARDRPSDVPDHAVRPSTAGPDADREGGDDHGSPERPPDRDRRASGPLGRDSRPRVGSTRRRPEHEVDAPAWERPRRYEAYPTLKTRVGMPDLPRVAVYGIVLAVAALALFLLPTLFLGGKAGPSASPTTAAVASVAASATPVPVATPLTYVVKSGDNMTKIARNFGVTVDQIMAANKDIKDQNKITLGQVIIIPQAAPSAVIDAGSPTPQASSSGAP